MNSIHHIYLYSNGYICSSGYTTQHRDTFVTTHIHTLLSCAPFLPHTLSVYYSSLSSLHHLHRTHFQLILMIRWSTLSLATLHIILYSHITSHISTCVASDISCTSAPHPSFVFVFHLSILTLPLAHSNLRTSATAVTPAVAPGSGSAQRTPSDARS